MGEKIKMEEKIQFQLPSMEDGEEEFYETIEAPKFVDFTRPNHFSPDDCFWFCSRVGCNRKHEEEMDSEAIYKNFVLRVMAARSPNIRLRRALTRRPSSESKKCPFSAPPKPSKSRLPRLALVSSISKKLGYDEKGTIKPPPTKPSSTPKARVKHVAAKYMTTPTKKKGGLPNPNSFRSVRNSKNTSITIPKNKVITKALVFNSPKKKALKPKALQELATPITKLCERVKKLEITSQKKSKSQKPSKEFGNVKKFLPSSASRKQPSACKAKTRSNDSSHVKNKAKRNEEKLVESDIHEARVGDDSSDMEIDEKLRTEEKSRIEQKCEGINQEKTSSNSSTSEMISFHDSEDRFSVQGNLVESEGSNADEQSKVKKMNSTEFDLENQNPRVTSGVMDNNDKENALSSDDNIRNMKGGTLSKHDAPVKLKVKTMEKTLKENCSTVIAMQKAKYRKLKPTSPKPFRLRTDERGILKEATLEKKINSHENNATITSENSQCTSNGVSENREKEGKKDIARSLKKDQIRPIKSKYKNTSNEVEPKLDKGPTPCSEKSSRKTKSPFLQKQVIRPRREMVPNAKPGELGVGEIEEKTATMSKPKESRKLSKVVVNPTNKVPKLVTQERRPAATMPREPKFHSTHKPKSCIKNMA